MPDKHKSYNLIPPEGHKEVGKRVFQVLAAIIADKQKLGLPDMWKKNYKLRRNKHWKTETASVPLISINLIYTHIQRSVNTLTDNNPIFNAISKTGDEGMRNKAMDLQRLAEDWWQDTEQQSTLEASVTNGEVNGICVEGVDFDAELAGGLGDVKTRIIDPMYFGWYPVEMTTLDDLNTRECVMEYWVESCRALKKKYPKMADKIKGDSALLDELQDDRRDINGTDGGKERNNILIMVQNVVHAVGGLFSNQTVAELDDEKTVVCKCYYRDDTETEDGEPIMDETGALIQNKRPKYTGGLRFIVACSGGQVVLEDKDNPNINPNLDPEAARQTYLYNKVPYNVTNSIIDTTNAWGITDLEDIVKLNMELNKSMSQLVMEKDSAARKIRVNPLDSGVKNEEFTSYPSIIRPSSAQSAMGIRYLEYPQNTQDVEKTIQLFKDLFLLVAGTFDMDMAQNQNGVIAYKSIAALLERSATMMRGKIRNYNKLVRNRGRMYVSHVQNFFTEERYVTFREAGAIEGKPVVGSELVGPINMTVVSGSTLPVSRVQQREEALQIFQAGAIDQQELLEKLDWSNRNEIIKRMQQGPIGQLVQRLAEVGLPDELQQYIMAIAQTDPKDVKKMLESGEMATFPQLMELMIRENMPEAEQIAGEQSQQMDPAIAESAAKVKKLEAEAGLTAAQTATEAVKQEVMLAGLEFDDQAMKLKRAEAVHKMEENVKSDGREDARLATEAVTAMNDIATSNAAGYSERGMKSNNADVKPKIEPRKDGGPVKAGKPYLVGEEGPEVIVPKQDGQVIPSKPKSRIPGITSDIWDEPPKKPESTTDKIKGKVGEAKEYLQQMGKDFKKIYSPEARVEGIKRERPPVPISKERAEELKVVKPGDREQLNDVLNTIDGTNEGKRKGK